jgi:hypothetical protein
MTEIRPTDFISMQHPYFSYTFVSIVNESYCLLCTESNAIEVFLLSSETFTYIWHGFFLIWPRWRKKSGNKY